MDLLTKPSNSDDEENDSFHSFNASDKSWDSLSSSLKSDHLSDTPNKKEHMASEAFHDFVSEMFNMQM